LGDLSAVKANIALPLKGLLDPTIAISWTSTHSNVIDSIGDVTRPDYLNCNDTLTASFTKNGQKVTKKFAATVIANDGTTFANNLLVKYDFSSVADSVVTDAAEKHFTGVLKNNARVHLIGTSVKYPVLDLGDSIGYFDMGVEVGKLMYNLTDYSVGAYYRIDDTYSNSELAKDGNFLWNFSNSKDIINVPTGYLIGSLRNQATTISSSNWNTEKTTAVGSPATKSVWHHFEYTQSGNIGSVYVDGGIVKSDTITSLPSTALPQSGLWGTLYNWIGRSCYTGDVYLRKTLVYDFRLYKTALTVDQITNSELDIANTISALEVAYAEAPNAVKTVSADSKYKVISGDNEINIQGLNGSEKVALFDITGRQLEVTNASSISVNSGAYIVKINNYVTKVMVK